MTRYYLSTPYTTTVVTVDEKNIILGQLQTKKEFTGRPLDELLEHLKLQGQVEMMKI